MSKVLKYRNEFKLKNLFTFLMVTIILFGTFFLLLVYKKDSLVTAEEIGENFGGWSYDLTFGWTSGSCNNLYGGVYENHCGVSVDPILDINFDGNDVNFNTNLVEDNSESYFDGTLVSFNQDNLRNGGKNKSNGSVLRDSNFDNSLYFPGVNSYISFGTQEALSFDGSDFTVSLWFKADQGLTGDVFLFSNGSRINEGYHCWVDSSYYLSCVIANQEISTSDPSTAYNNPLIAEKWYNLSIIDESNIFSMYLNGVFVDDVDIGSFVVTGAEELVLGSFSDYTNNFKGELDEFRFFDYALSADQVLQNIRYNSNYLLNVEEGSGDMNGWLWSSGVGWICFGDTCDTSTPDAGTSYAKLYWSAQGNDTYPHMIRGWANAVAFNDAQGEYKDTGWLSLQSEDIIIANYDEYDDCVSCSFRDEENGLVLYLKMDEDAGLTAIDSSGFGNNGELIDFEEPGWTNEGRVGNCLTFDGKDDYVVIDAAENDELKIGFSDFTIETWIKNEKEHESIDQLSIISGAAPKKWELYFNPENNNLVFEIFNKSVQVLISDISDWTHVVVRADRNGNLEMYINSILGDVVDISDKDDQFVDNNNFSIGKNNSNGAFWDDKIDIVRLYTRALTRDEISYNFNYPEKSFCSACLSQTLDEVENTDFSDVCYKCERCVLENEVTNCEICSSCREYGLVFDSNTASIQGFAWGGFTSSEGEIGLKWFKFSPRDEFGLYRSYVSAKYGNVYSRENIGSDYSIAPPKDYFNATYMIQTNGHITNWISSMYKTDSSWHMSSESGNPLDYEYPKLENDYGNILGNLDYNGLINGLYGEVIENDPSTLNDNFLNENSVNPNFNLNNKVYYQVGDYSIEPKTGNQGLVFNNYGNGGAGTIIIDGDLTINANIQYSDATFSGSSSDLASVAWIIKGDLKIAPEVTELAGTFIVLGQDGLECGYNLDNPVEHCGAVVTCDTDEINRCGNQLKVSGQFLAKSFVFGRTYRSLESQLREAAEEIIYDGRNIINPAPGLGDILKVLPTWNQIAPFN